MALFMHTCMCVYVHTMTCVHMCVCIQVEDAWKSTEFILLSHRDSKDVFILGGTDDIQVLLDDSQVWCGVVWCVGV